MSKPLGMVREAIKIMEKLEKELEVAEQEQVGSVKLASLQRGDIFKTEIGQFVILSNNGESVKVMTNGIFKPDVRFEKNGKPDYKVSDLKKICDGEVYEKVSEVFGAENILDDEVDLTTLDGQREFGTVTCKVHPLTFDEARQCTELIAKMENEDWIWTCTPWSTPDRGFDYSVVVVNPDGSRGNGYAYNSLGAAVVCTLKLSIRVQNVE